MAIDAFVAIIIGKTYDEIGLSALLTTTMPVMKEVIDEFTKRGIRHKYIFMIGGAPITADYAKQIGADHYAADGATAAQLAKSLLVSQ